MSIGNKLLIQNAGTKNGIKEKVVIGRREDKFQILMFRKLNIKHQNDFYHLLALC